MNFRKLFEAPENGLDMDTLPAAVKFSKQALEYIQNVTPYKNLFSDFMYGIYKNAFVVFKNSEIVLYIIHESNNNTMKIKNIENISNIKNLQFRVLSAILNLNLYNKIYTGSVLSTKNIKSHKKYIQTGFNLYISDTNKLVTKDNFDIIMKKSDKKTEFVLTNTKMNEILIQTYNTCLLGDYINNTITEIVNQGL